MTLTQLKRPMQRANAGKRLAWLGIEHGSTAAYALAVVAGCAIGFLVTTIAARIEHVKPAERPPYIEVHPGDLDTVKLIAE